jgi:DNA-binding NarL/FixJ family response regulator
MIRVLIVEDHPLIVEAVRYQLNRDPEFEIVGELKNSQGLAKLVREKQVDVLLLDLSLSGETFEPVTAVRVLTKGNPNLGILVLTGMDSPLLMNALIEAGALGYILKSDDLSLLVRAVKAVHNRNRFYSDQVQTKLLELDQTNQLTEMEYGILRLMAAGLSNEAIASRLFFSEQYIRNAIGKIYEKLGVGVDRTLNLRVACINKARELGLLNEG